jgi:hypothetical protein
MAVGDEGAHPELLGEREGLAVPFVGALHGRCLALHLDRGEQSDRMGLVPAFAVFQSEVESLSGERKGALGLPRAEVRLGQSCQPQATGWP